MTHVSSLELSKKLYELSGWEHDVMWAYPVSHPGRDYPYFRPAMGLGPINGDIPTYDLGYLIRRIPEWIDWHLSPNPGVGFYISSTSVEDNIPRADGDTPENALARFHIALFKQGILKRGES